MVTSGRGWVFQKEANWYNGVLTDGRVLLDSCGLLVKFSYGFRGILIF